MVRPYRFVSRPPNTEHGHPFLVYDCHGQLHYPLTRFAKLALGQRTLGTVKGYLYVLLPFFTWLDTDPRQLKHQRCWNAPAQAVRSAVEDYLTQQMQCQLHDHVDGFQLVYRTAKTPSEIRTFLSALKCFYKVMERHGYYACPNPLVDASAEVLALAVELDEEDGQPPRMPAVSGVEKPRARKRLTDSYYKLEGDQWLPKIIDDPSLPAQILLAGRQLPNWKLREDCVTRMLFETGGRVSEVVGLTLEDWFVRGLAQEANTFSKRSRGRRVKFLRFSLDTAKLLRRYFNTERIHYDPHHYTLDDYLERSQKREIDLQTVPLFLTQQRTALSPQNFRDNYWKPATQRAGIEADLHQTRHWYVTNAIRQIHQVAAGDVEIARLRQALKDYMKWKSEETIKAYDHYFDSLAHAKLQDDVHARLDLDLQRRLEAFATGEISPGRVAFTPPSNPPATPIVEDEDFDYLRQIGGSKHDRRTGI